MVKRSILEGLKFKKLHYSFLNFSVVFIVVMLSESSDATISRLSDKKLQDYGQLSALVIFAQFANEGISKKAPSWSKDLFNVTVPGSFSHFYQDMSGGRLSVVGAVLPNRYSSFQDKSKYIAEEPGVVGEYGRFNLEILSQADQDSDFGMFDNDGPDGIPNSGDDDGYVDIVFINLHTVPAGFFIETATGLASLGLDKDFVSNDKAFSGDYIRIGNRFRGFSGTTQRGHVFSVTASTMCHEFGHVLGLTDLFDQSSLSANGALDPVEDSAGIGNWGLMGLGTLGWGIEDGPNAFSAPSLLELGWVDVVELSSPFESFVIEELFSGRKVYKIPVHKEEYFLIEYRRSIGSFYNRNIPRDGLLIWHVDERADNDEERHKRVDLVCADGLYVDKGFPSSIPDGIRGRDNLDFWSRDINYANQHNGNKGDATDPFDGIKYTRFSHDTNPPLRAHTGSNRGAALPLGLENIREENGRMLVDIVSNELDGVITGRTRWEGDIRIDGDVVVAPEATLVLANGASIGFESGDARQAGFDEKRSELLIYGKLEIEGQVHFSSANLERRDDDWGGILLMDGQDIGKNQLIIEHALWGIVRFRLPEGKTIWDESKILWGDMLVPDNATLVINPGVEIFVSPIDLMFNGISANFSELKIDGSLQINGNAGSPIRITAQSGVVEEPLWYGIIQTAGAKVEIQHSKIDRAGYGVYGEVGLEGSLRLADVELTDFAASAIRLVLNRDAEIVRSSMIRSSGPAIQVNGDGQLRLIDVEIMGNGREGISIQNCNLYGEQVYLENNGSFDANDLRSGILFKGGFDQNLTLKSSSIKKNSAHGILLLDSFGFVDIEDSFIGENGGAGIRVGRALGVRLDEVKVFGNQEQGIRIDSTNVHFNEIEVKTNIQHALKLGLMTTGTISESYFGEGLGSVLDSVGNIRIENNFFERTLIGLDVNNSNADIFGNRFINNSIGLKVNGSSLPNAIKGNVFSGNSTAVENLTDKTLSIQENYWGELDSLKILGLMNGPVDFANFIKVDPYLEAVALDSIVEKNEMELYLPFPNPYNPKVYVLNIPINLTESGSIEMVIWDVLGSEIYRLKSAVLDKGLQNIEWNGKNDSGEYVASGIYFYRIWSTSTRSEGRLTLIR